MTFIDESHDHLHEGTTLILSSHFFTKSEGKNNERLSNETSPGNKGRYRMCLDQCNQCPMPVKDRQLMREEALDRVDQPF